MPQLPDWVPCETELRVTFHNTWEAPQRFFFVRHWIIKWCVHSEYHLHYSDIILGVMAAQITSLTILYSTVYSGANQRKHQSSVSLAFVLGIHRGPVNSPHKWPVTRNMFPFEDFIMCYKFGNGFKPLIPYRHLISNTNHVLHEECCYFQLLRS